MAKVHTLDELAYKLDQWLREQEAVTDVERIIGWDVAGRENFGFRIDGMGISLEMAYTEQMP